MYQALRAAIVALLPVSLLAAGTTVSKPEDAGLSSERLGRIRPLVERHIAAKDLSGAVTLVARRGKVVHFEAQVRMEFPNAVYQAVVD